MTLDEKFNSSNAAYGWRARSCAGLSHPCGVQARIVDATVRKQRGLNYKTVTLLWLRRTARAEDARLRHSRQTVNENLHGVEITDVTFP